MGICASCLGGNRRDSLEPESSRLLDEDPYQTSYNYGSLHAQQANQQPDPESVRREREALDAICQRTSDSVIDIWSLQPQPHLQPQATLPAPVSVSNSPTPSRDPKGVTVVAVDKDNSRPSSGNTAPKHWGEVVVNTNKKRSRQNLKDDGDARDVFGVLKVT
ncbi:Uncharacterized protein PECH_002887 [Penicillium ucsense]|uniref:Ragulator complex protein LAMTOR1 n=2 Tax=Penicillium TaxID=5073 RepID=A0A8J8W897_9EURO|nr:uncharacterized protein N7539_001055 [Penicillium diatomitis]KAF7718285.1 Uncharacterized protein PECM_002669 [Penicillium ucsense]KAF7730210.1 Uncharacterized protein PECH_002887 [Penicillium ucsense]KAJ5495939.1 hypothetical protein N7539_001055 [Penicillium diatomitis]